MSARQLVTLGTSSQSPTRKRSHNANFLRWDRRGFLFDPGESTQRQLLFAGIPSSAITDICITHFHGDHCLGLAGMVQRLAADDVQHTVRLFFPADGIEYAERLINASVYDRRVDLELHPVDATHATSPVTVFTHEGLALRAAALDHRITCLGWQLIEDDRRKMDASALEARGIQGPAVARLQAAGSALAPDGTVVALDVVSSPVSGQRFAFVMDTRLCKNAAALAERADLLVCEATYLTAEAELADKYRHLTAAQAAGIAQQAGARLLVLTHFSQRYVDTSALADEARAIHPDVVAAEDLMAVDVPRRA
jgi:ribonuclease Z